MAPGAEPANRSYDCPGQTEDPPRVDWPRVDDYRSDIDFESQEMIGGVVYDVMGADYPHARRNGHLDYLLQGIAAPGYGIASDLKTRVADDDDFATEPLEVAAVLDAAKADDAVVRALPALVRGVGQGG